jgi:hypothetical protein
MIKVTYDEVLLKIDDEGEFLVQHFDSKPIVHSALRAVIQLHVPKYHNIRTDCGVNGWFESCAECKVQYPCQTFLAIAKELG